jgi:hypothetical protein
MPDKFRVGGPLEQCIWNSANENLSRGDASMDEGFGVADVPVNDPDAPPPQGCVDVRIEIDYRDFSEKILSIASQFFQQGTCRPKEANQKNARGRWMTSRRRRFSWFAGAADGVKITKP